MESFDLFGFLFFFLRKWGNFENENPDGDDTLYYHWNKIKLSKQQEKLLQFTRNHMGKKAKGNHR